MSEYTDVPGSGTGTEGGWEPGGDVITPGEGGTTEIPQDTVTEGGTVQTVPMHEDYVNIDLQSGTVHRSFLDHVICQDNCFGNLFGVKLYKGGEPAYLLSGATCEGFFIRPDGNTVTIIGTVAEVAVQGEGQRCYVILPQACYAYTGQFTLLINLHVGNFTSTVRVVDGTIVKTRTGEVIDPGIPIPGIDDLLALIAGGQTYTAGPGLQLQGLEFSAKTGYTQSGSNYPVTTDENGNLYVNVPGGGGEYSAAHGVEISSGAIQLTESVRKHMNCLRIVHLSHGESADLGTASATAGYIVVIWKCGTGGTNGIKFAHVTNTDAFSETNIVNTGTDNCTLAFDSDSANSNANPHWTITNGHASVDMRAFVLMSSTSEVYC